MNKPNEKNFKPRALSAQEAKAFRTMTRAMALTESEVAEIRGHSAVAVSFARSPQ